MHNALRSALAALLFFTPVVANAHSWYAQECCNGEDCHPIDDCDQIVETKEGFTYVTPEGYTIYFNHKDEKPSQDTKCHVCYPKYGHLGLKEWKGYCVYRHQSM